MPSREVDGPQPACVEDYDDDRDTVFSDTRVHARAVKDGSDSGYSSRTGTIDGDQPVQLERKRTPYIGIPPQNRPRDSMQAQRPARLAVAEPVRAPQKEDKKKFCHPPGVCWTCDRVGYHMTQEELDELKDRLRRQKSSTKEAPKSAREPPPPEAKERPVESKLRRMSSLRDSRPPVQQYPPSSMPQMQAPPLVSAGFYAGYPSPMTPGYPSQQPYPQYPYLQTPTTPMGPSYVSQPPQEYFPQAVPELRPPRPRRASTYGDQAPERVPRHYEEPHYARRELLPAAEVLPVRKETRPANLKHASSRHMDQDRYERDRMQMPPPEVPIKRVEAAPRPSPKKSYTYADSGHGRSSVEEPRQAVPDTLERRRSRPVEDYDQDATRALRSVRTRDELEPQAPSAYKSESRDLPSRPAAQKSVSYSDPRHVQTVAKSSKPQEPVRRRVTEPQTPLDAKVAEAEAYQQKRTSMISDGLPTEQIKASKSSRAPSRSDAGSNYSHRESHYSTSKQSSATTKPRRDSIVIETGGKSRPLSIQMPNGLTIQMGGDHAKEKEKEKEKEEKKKQKLIEQAPHSSSSVSQSTTSRSRATTSSHASTDRGRDRDYQEKSSKRSSQIESRPPATPVKTTTSSRAPSRSRAASDTSGGRHRRQSVVSERIVVRR